MRPRLPLRDAVSAGGIVWRRAGDGSVEIVVCGSRALDAWVLPKGTPDAGESMEQTALREVREETGLDVTLGEPLASISYWFTADGVRYRKRVSHWLMEAIGGDTANHDHEFDDVIWIPIGEAYRRVAYENQRGVIAEAARRLGVSV